METRKATGEAEPSDTEATVSGFNIVHFVYKMFLSNFLKFTLNIFYFLFLFLNVISCQYNFYSYKVSDVLAHCH